MKYDSPVKKEECEVDSLIKKEESDSKFDSPAKKRIRIEESSQIIPGPNYLLFGHIECECKEIILTESSMKIMITRVESIECRIDFEIDSGDINQMTTNNVIIPVISFYLQNRVAT